MIATNTRKQRKSDEEFELNKRLPPLTWNKPGDADIAMHESAEYVTEVEGLLELVKQLKDHLFRSELNKRLSALPTDKRQVYSIAGLEQVLQSYRDNK